MARPFVIVTGVKELDANLQALAGPGQTRASISGLRAGLRDLARAERQLAPRGQTGALKASIGQRILRQSAVGILGKAGINVGGAGKRNRLNVVNQGRMNATGPYSRRARRILAGATTKGRGQRARSQFAAGAHGGFAPHSHLVALGTKPRYTKGGQTRQVWSQRAMRWRQKSSHGGRAYRGVMPRNDFIRRAFSQAVNSVRFAIREALAAAIAREVNKFGRKTGRAVQGVG